MKNPNSKSEDALLLRQKAEELQKKRPSKSLPYLSKAETLKLIHELEVHQIELEMQNEELVQAITAAEAAIALYDFAPSGYFTITGDGIILKLNLFGAQMLGKERMNLVNKTLAVFVTDDTKATYNDFLARACKNQVKESCEVKLLSNDHTLTQVLLTGIASETGKQCFVTMVDITERKKAEVALARILAELKQTTKLLERTGEMAKVGGWELDLMTNKMLFSREALLINDVDPLVGLTLEEALNRVDPEYRPLLQTAVQAAIENSTPFDMDLPMVTANGRHIWVRTQGFALMENGKAVKLYGAFQDITDRKQAEEALRERDERFRTVTALAPAGIYLTDPQGNCQYANPAWCRMAGLGLEEALGKGWLKGLHPDDRDMVISNWKKMVESQGQWGHEYRFMTREGTITWVYGLATPQSDSSGKIIAYVGVNQNITERKQLEAEREKSEQQQNQMQKLESLGLLAGGIAHDFNNLMGGIFGYIELAQCESDKTLSSEYLSKALASIDRSRALTRQLLTFAKGGAPIQKIGHLFPFVEETAKFALSGANVSCQFDVQDDLWACNFDKNQIGQVIDNIVINAQQAMPVGGTMALSARNIALAENEHPLVKAGNYVKISITDTGVGIPEEHIQRIFDPFFTTKQKGHGLGLATCYSIIKRHEGCIDVESEPGKGSTFKVYLPASTESASAAVRNAAKPHKGSGTFLIMDDEEVMRDTIGDMLETMGYTVIRKENGKDALSFFASDAKADRTIAGMIFDLTVPGGMGGKAAIEELRKTHTNIPPVFVASGYADDPVMKNPTEYGFIASICKPIRVSELSEMLDNYMKPKK